MSSAGSSPLARGLLHFGGQVPHVARIIPARAGFTYIDKWAEIKAKDHPRSRGVYPGLGTCARVRGGSSPLARGLPRYFNYDKDDARIIPARAGFTAIRFPGVTFKEDHPRSRGVYSRA